MSLLTLPLLWPGSTSSRLGPVTPPDSAAATLPPVITGAEPEARAVLPLREPGVRFGRHTEALDALSRPALFEDRPSYRLLGVSWDVDASQRTDDADRAAQAGGGSDVPNTPGGAGGFFVGC